ncbi:MAG TPA: hypothetical protein VFU40_03265 [Gemmatimonadales bacterium]|nr:hypothetical protein [Gemmatimonadales bacterium]
MRTAAVLLLLLPAGQAAAQEPLETKLIVQQGGRETGREEFTLRQGRGRGASGTTLIAVARYPATNPQLKLAAVLERTPESALAKFQLDVQGPDGTTVILAAGSGARLIVRTVAKGSEAGRELPGGPDVVLLDDALFSLYVAVADLATPSGRSLTGVFPRTSRRASFRARLESGGDAGGKRVTLSGDINGSLVTDARGRLQRLELPDSGIVVTRLPG